MREHARGQENQGTVGPEPAVDDMNELQLPESTLPFDLLVAQLQSNQFVAREAASEILLTHPEVRGQVLDMLQQDGLTPEQRYRLSAVVQGYLNTELEEYETEGIVFRAGYRDSELAELREELHDAVSTINSTVAEQTNAEQRGQQLTLARKQIEAVFGEIAEMPRIAGKVERFSSKALQPHYARVLRGESSVPLAAIEHADAVLSLLPTHLDPAGELQPEEEVLPRGPKGAHKNRPDPERREQSLIAGIIRLHGLAESDPSVIPAFERVIAAGDLKEIERFIAMFRANAKEGFEQGAVAHPIKPGPAVRFKKLPPR